MEIVWSRLAKETLVDVLNYVEINFGRNIAIKVYDRLSEHVESLALFPRMGVRASSYSDSEVEVRYIINTPNVIHYLIVDDIIVIISVLDTRRSPNHIDKIVSDFINRYK